MGRRRQLSTSRLFAKRISGGPLGDLVIWRPSRGRLANLDRRWRRLRPAHHQNLHWSWEKTEKDHRDFFAVGRHSEILGLWASKAPQVQLMEGRFYRLDRLEIDPDCRKGSLGALLIGMIAWRAVELRCSGIVGATFPEIVDWYERLGAEQRCPKGWNHERGLVPIAFGKDAVGRLREETDELFEDSP